MPLPQEVGWPSSGQQPRLRPKVARAQSRNAQLAGTCPRELRATKWRSAKLSVEARAWIRSQESHHCEDRGWEPWVQAQMRSWEPVAQSPQGPPSLAGLHRSLSCFVKCSLVDQVSAVHTSTLSDFSYLALPRLRDCKRVRSHHGNWRWRDPCLPSHAAPSPYPSPSSLSLPSSISPFLFLFLPPPPPLLSPTHTPSAFSPASRAHKHVCP